MGKRHITISDIARELNISPSTVSRALRDETSISEQTRSKVWETANKLGYQPNPFARGLVSQSSRVLGLIIPEIDVVYFVKVIDAILSTAEKSGFQVITCLSHGSFKQEQEQVERLIASRVDGVMVCYSSETVEFSHFTRLIDQGIPVVFFDRNTEELDAPFVISDDFQGARLAMQHLIDKGRRKILHLRGPEALSISFYRHVGYRETLIDNQIPLNPDWVIDALDARAEKIDNEDHLYRMLMEVDAVFAFNDYAAYQVLLRLRELGRKVPQEVAIVGFGDLPMAEYLTPTLSTVAQPAFLVGQTTVQQMVKLIINDVETDEIEKKGQQELILLPNSLVIRESS